MKAAEPDWRIGILSDTHGLLRPQVMDALQGVNQILHAGDVGTSAILQSLQRIAPVTAIRGNVDIDGDLARLPATEMVRLGNSTLTAYLIHSVHDLDIDPVAAAVSLVVSGHSHSPSLTERMGVVYLNPGSVGARRFKLPVSMAFATIRGNSLSVEFKTIDLESTALVHSVT